MAVRAVLRTSTIVLLVTMLLAWPTRTPAATDTNAPSRPAGLTATASGCDRMDVRWAPSSDRGGSGLAGYDVFRNGALLERVVAPATTLVDSGLAPSTRYRYEVVAVDGAGNRSARRRAKRTTPACQSLPPIAHAGPDQFTQTLTPVAFAGGGSSDPDGTIVSWAWTFGDGLSGSGASVSHTYARAGSYTVTLTVTDNQGARATDTVAVSITDRPPVAEAGAAYTGAPGTPVAFTGTGSADPDGTITTWAWSFGDGATGSGASPKHTYAAAGTYTAVLTVTDDSGAQASDTATVTVVSAAASELRWTKQFGGGGFGDGISVKGIATTPAGDLVAAGALTGTVALGGASLTSGGGSDVLVAAYAGGDGRYLWSRRFGGLDHQYATALAVDAAGNIVIAGNFLQSVDFGTGALTSAGNFDVFLAMLSPSGTVRWAKRLGGSGNDLATGVAFDGSGNVIVTGSTDAVVDLGGGSLGAAGGTDIFVAAYDGATGGHRWSKRLGASGNDAPAGVAVDSAGYVTICGAFAGSVNFGEGSLRSSGGADVFVAQYVAATGAPVWSRRYGAGGDDACTGVAVDATGDVAITGHFDGSVDFGGGPLVNTGAPDIFLVQLSAAGAHRWSKRFGTAATYATVATGVAIDASGNVALGANVIDGIAFGGSVLPLSGGYDPVVAKFSPSGAPLWSRRFPSLSLAYNYSSSVAMDGAGNVFTAGSFSGVMDVAGTSLVNGGSLVNHSYDGFVAAFGP